MTGMPFMGGLGQLELIQEIVGEVPPTISIGRNASITLRVSGRLESRIATRY